MWANEREDRNSNLDEFAVSGPIHVKDFAVKVLADSMLLE